MRSTTTAVIAATLVTGWAISLSGIASADPPEPPPPGPSAMDHDGTYAVGTDVAPGIYSSAGPVGDGTCYWKLTNGSNTVDNAMSRKPQVVRIDPADTAFKTDGCQPWQSTPDASPPAPLSPLAAGAQLGGLLSIINNGASQAGDTPPPHP